MSIFSKLFSKKSKEWKIKKITKPTPKTEKQLEVVTEPTPMEEDIEVKEEEESTKVDPCKVISSLRNELSNIGVNTQYVGVQLLEQVIYKAATGIINADTDYDKICSILYPGDPLYAKRNITFVRKKIASSKGVESSIFSNTASLTNEGLIKALIEMAQ